MIFECPDCDEEIAVLDLEQDGRLEIECSECGAPLLVTRQTIVTCEVLED